MITITDFLIIYLACGAPFGVYYFFQHRKKYNLKKLLLNSFLTMTVWIPYAFKLLLKNVKSKLNTQKISGSATNESLRQDNFVEAEKSFSHIIRQNKIPIPLFEFRETFERYVGLSNSLKNADEAATDAEREIFKITETESREVSALCLHRRNLNRLKSHHTFARKDLIEFFGQIDANISTNLRQKFRHDVFNLFAGVNDSEGFSIFSESCKNRRKIEQIRVSEKQGDIWIPQKTQSIPLHKKIFSIQAAGRMPTRKED